MFDTGKFSYLFFELLDIGAVVSQPTTIKHVLHALEKILTIPDVGLADMKEFLEEGLAAKEGKVVNFLLIHLVT